MSDQARLANFLESSFLSPLLLDSGITDISYNGVSLFYEHRDYGRQKSTIEVSKEAVGDFLRQIANFSEKQFSYLSPKLDVSFSRYRINAMFSSVVRVKDEKSYSFALRIGQEGSAILSGSAFFPGKSEAIILEALSRHESIVIAGETGAGKTELQKYLLLHLPPASRVIVIDNVEELELSRGDGSLDLTSWLVDERGKDSSFSSLIKNALRNNPDYLLVAEARGGEMLDALNAAMSGHPILMTIHAKSLEAIPYRMARLAMMGGDKLVFDDLLGDIYHHFSLVLYLRKEIREDGVHRYLSSIGRLNESTRSVDVIFKKEEGE